MKLMNDLFSQNINKCLLKKISWTTWSNFEFSLKCFDGDFAAIHKTDPTKSDFKEDWHTIDAALQNINV